MTKPAAKRGPYHHGDLARALVEAALRKIESSGVEGFTLRDAAREVGVTHTAVYRHFVDKRALLATIAEEGFRALTEEMTSSASGARSADDAPRRLDAMGRAYVRYAMREPARYRVMFGPRLNVDDRYPTLEREARAAFQTLEDAIAEGVRAGTLVDRPPRELATLLWMSAHGYASLVLHGRIESRAERAESSFATIIEPLLSGLGATRLG